MYTLMCTFPNPIVILVLSPPRVKAHLVLLWGGGVRMSFSPQQHPQPRLPNTPSLPLN
jgi:hypothetical protein